MRWVVVIAVAFVTGCSSSGGNDDVKGLGATGVAANPVLLASAPDTPSGGQNNPAAATKPDLNSADAVPLDRDTGAEQIPGSLAQSTNAVSQGAGSEKLAAPLTATKPASDLVQSSAVAQTPMPAVIDYVLNFPNSSFPVWKGDLPGNGEKERLTKKAMLFSDTKEYGRVVPVYKKTDQLVQVATTDRRLVWMRRLDAVLLPEPCKNQRFIKTGGGGNSQVSAGAGKVSVSCS